MPRLMRTIPADVQAPDFAQLAAPPVLADLKLLVTTPMFGGGTDPGVVDTRSPIRASAIRGSLRYWWRACNISGYASLEAMKSDERTIWGSAAKENDDSFGPGAIALRVELLTAGENTFQFHDDRSLTGQERLAVQGWYDGERPNSLGSRTNKPKAPTYVLFPFQATNETEERPGQVGVSFRLIMTLATNVWSDTTLADRCIESARQALWAWIAFGGVGSRTRRGCGSLWCEENGELATTHNDEVIAKIGAKELQPPEHGLAAWLSRTGGTLVKQGGTVTGPSLHGAAFRVSGGKTHITAWSTAVQPYSDFRQGKDAGRNPGGGNRPGQSRWPEPGAVRAKLKLPDTNVDQEGHTYFKPNTANGGDFPRADLGLPLLFQNMTGLQGAAELSRDAKGATRFASPLIVKALAVTKERSVPIALMLNSPHLWELQDTPQLVLKHPDKRLVEKDPAQYAPKIKSEPMNVPAIHWPTKGPSAPNEHFDKPKGVSESNVSIRDAYLAYLDLPANPNNPLDVDKPVWKSGVLKSLAETNNHN